MIDDRKGSLTSGQEINLPASVIETPPLNICAIRLYSSSTKGLNSITEVWAGELSKDLSRVVKMSKNYDFKKALERAEALIKEGKVNDIRVIACTNPRLAGVPKKKPDLVEIRVGGESIEKRWEYSKNILGKQVSVGEVFKGGEHVDVIAITKGKGFQGPIKRWGIKILPRKQDDGSRQIGTLGPWKPSKIMWTVPQAGQMGYNQRTEFNKRILKIGKDGREITPAGGFLRYGPIKSDFILLAGSVPGPTKRLIHIRYPVRPPKGAPQSSPVLTYVSLASQQGA
jgi:large subunit ribosomal protein L3